MNIEAQKDAFRNLLASEGWRLIDQFIQERISDNKDRLMTCKVEQVMDLRSKVDAYNSIYSHLNEILEGEEEIDESTN